MNRFVLSLLILGFAVLFAPHAAAQTRKPPATKPAVVTQRGHTSMVTALTVSKDGKWLITGERGDAVLWETATGREVRRFKGHRDFIMRAGLSDDGLSLVTSSGSGLLAIDLEKNTSEPLDASIRLWNAATGKQVGIFKAESGRNVAISPDGKFLASRGNKTRLWDTRTGKQLRTFDDAWFFFFSNDSNRLFTADEQRVRVWDLATGGKVREFDPFAKALNVKDFSDFKLFPCAEGKRVIILGVRYEKNHQVVLWDVESARQIHACDIDKTVEEFAVSPNGRWIFLRSDKFLKMVDIATGKEVRDFGQIENPESTPRGSMCVSRDGKWLFTAESANELDVCARMYDIATGKEVRVFRRMVESVNALAISDDGKRLVVGFGSTKASDKKDRFAVVWDLAAGKLLRVYEGHDCSVGAVAISGDGKLVASGEFGGDFVPMLVFLWDAESGQLLRVFDHIEGSNNALALSADSESLWTLAGENHPDSVYGALQFNLETGKPIRKLKLDSVGMSIHGAFSRDGKWLATGGFDKIVRLWNLSTRKAVRVLKGHTSAILAVAFSRDGQWLVTAGSDARLWNPAIGKQIRVFKGHEGMIRSVALSQDGRLLATGGSLDRTVRLWNLANGKPLGTLQGHAEAINSIVFSPDGKRLISASDDGTTRIWDVKTRKELCCLVTLRDGTWVVCDSEGRFDSADGKTVPGVQLVSGMETFSLRHHDRGLLAKYLGFNREPLRPLNNH